jgi:hypothetical protein
LDKQKDSEKRRQTRIKSFEKNIAQWQHDLENPPELEDLGPINEGLVRLSLFSSSSSSFSAFTTIVLCLTWLVCAEKIQFGEERDFGAP